MGVTPAYLESVASFYDLFHTEPDGPPPGARLHQHLLLDERRRRAARAPSARRPASTTHEAGHGGASSRRRRALRQGFECLGACDIAPMASIDERYYGPLERRRRRRRDRGAARRATRSCPTRRWRSARPPAAPSPTRDPRVARRPRGQDALSETRILFRNIDEPGLRDDRRLPSGSAATRALERAFREIEPDELLTELEDSGLRGRGGAGFSMGKKAGFLPRGDMEKYLCCNADESEPGTFKDRELMHKNPHQLVEGVRDRRARRRRDATPSSSSAASTRRSPTSSTRAVAEAYDGRLPRREHPRHRQPTSSVVVHRGAGAYICGEETALLDSLEGKRGNPRLKPPFPAIQGLYGGPTLINNVETLMNVPHIVNNGADWFKGFGTEQSTGTKVVSVSGCVKRPGNYEIELGIPSREIIYGLAGGPPDGPRGQGLVPRRLLGAGADREELDLPYSLRGDGRGRLDARLGRDHRRRRDGLDPDAGAADRALLPPRVVRQVHALPRGHQLDGEDARAGRPRRGDADGPRHHRLGPGEHHRQLPLRPRRRDGDAGRLDGRASSAASSRTRSPAAREPAARRRSTCAHARRRSASALRARGAVA